MTTVDSFPRPLSFPSISAFKPTFIKTFNPVRCQQKKLTNDAPSLVFFGAMTARLFPAMLMDSPFPALSILTILLDQCQTKSFEEERYNQYKF